MSQDSNPNEVDEVKGLGEVEMETGMDQGNTKDTNLYEACIKDTPESPASNIFLDDTTCPPSSDIASSDVERHGAHPPGSALKRKHFDDPDVKKKPPCRMEKRKRISEVEMGIDDNSCEECGESRSAVASRKLKELLKSGQFVVDKQKRVVFEEKCKRMGNDARFRYGEKWEVLHLKCGKWSTMTEPYNTTRFKTHVNMCKSQGSKGHNGCIDSFFRPRTGSEHTGTPAKSIKRPSIMARRQVAVGIHSTNTDPETPAVITESLPCLGLREEHNDKIPKYISRSLTEGAGSWSDSYVTVKLFGDGTKYSELGDKGKQLVQAAQVLSRMWTINRELQAIYSTNCRKAINTMSAESTCPECLGVLRLDAFKKALSIEPAPLGLKKYIPRRWRTAATDLAVNLAEINGLSGLLEAVSPSPSTTPFIG